MIIFKPPIAERTTESLLLIVGAPEKWNYEAVEQAIVELNKRKVSDEQIKHAEYLSKKSDRFEESI